MPARYIKNIENNRILPWAERLARKKNHVECDSAGNPVYSGSSVSDKDLLSKVADLVEQLNRAERKAVEQDKVIQFYVDMFGTKESLTEKSVDAIKLNMQRTEVEAKLEEVVTKPAKAKKSE